MFYALASHGPRTLLYSQEVWFKKSVALTTISFITDKQIEPSLKKTVVLRWWEYHKIIWFCQLS